MIRRTKTFALLTTFGAAAALLCSALAQAAPGTIQVHDAWVRWLPGKLPSAGYMTFENNGATAVDLVGVDSRDYGMSMLHQTITNGSTSRMEMVDKLTIPAHGQVAVAPGGYHFMFEDAKHAIKPGDTVQVKLRFSNGETLDLPVPVKSPAQAQ